jgi:hypothetical protein
LAEAIGIAAVGGPGQSRKKLMRKGPTLLSINCADQENICTSRADGGKPERAALPHCLLDIAPTWSPLRRHKSPHAGLDHLPANDLKHFAIQSSVMCLALRRIPNGGGDFSASAGGSIRWRDRKAELKSRAAPRIGARR